MSKVFGSLYFTFALSINSCNPLYGDSEISVKPSPKHTKVEIDKDARKEMVTSPVPTSIKGIITQNGFENVMFGMTEVEIRKAFKHNLTRDYDPEYPECYYLYEDTGDISFTIYSGTLQRIDVYSSLDVVTDKGAAIGMSFEAAEKLYPNSYRKPNFYTYPDENLVVQLNENIKIIFEQRANEIISHFRVGTLPSIDFVEGCL